MLELAQLQPAAAPPSGLLAGMCLDAEKTASGKNFCKTRTRRRNFYPQPVIEPQENTPAYDNYASGPTIYAYVDGNPINWADPWGLYLALVVTLPNQKPYTPLTTVKNSAQAKSYGQPIGTVVHIAVPPGVNPQSLVNEWSNGSTSNGLGEFAIFWWPSGAHDYKQQNAMYDAFGNFEYGATGTANGIPASTLQGMANFIHGGKNYPINTMDIQSGIWAITNGGTLSTKNISGSTSNSLECTVP